MDAREDWREQAVATHAHPNAGLAELEDKKNAADGKEGAERDNAAKPGQTVLENVGQRIADVEFAITDDAGQNEGNQHVKNRADDERIENSPGQVALRIFTFLGGGGNSVETDECP